MFIVRTFEPLPDKSGCSYPLVEQALEEGHGRSNRQTLFGISAIPSDNDIRLMLDGAGPAAFNGLFFKAAGLRGR